MRPLTFGAYKMRLKSAPLTCKKLVSMSQSETGPAACQVLVSHIDEVNCHKPYYYVIGNWAEPEQAPR